MSLESSWTGALLVTAADGRVLAQSPAARDLLASCAGGNSLPGELAVAARQAASGQVTLTAELTLDGAVVSALLVPQPSDQVLIVLDPSPVLRAKAAKDVELARSAADAASQAKSQFLATMSHEIRTPLAAILGMTQLTLDTRLTPEQRGYLQRALNNSEILLALVDDILDVERIGSGQLQLRYAELDIAELLEEACESLALRANAKFIELVCDAEVEASTYHLGDVNRLRQVVINLLTNAIKYTDSGEVVARARVIERAGSGLDWIEIAISDTGIGIPRDRLDDIFGRFVQLERIGAAPLGGVGLGLSIVRSLVTLMGGTVGVESELGQGSVFKVSLPLERSGERPLSASLAGIEGLVVETNAAARAAMMRILSAFGMKVQAFPSSSPAAEALQSGAVSPRVLLLDAACQDPVGLRQTAELRMGSKLPVVLTFPGARINNDLMNRLGTGNAVAKPVRRQRLRDALEQALGVQARVSTHPSRVVPLRTRRPVKLLVVEDNQDSLRLVTRLLERAGYQISTAQTGLMGLNRIKQDRFAAVVCDIAMPTMDGLTMTRNLRQWERESGVPPTPVIALTAHAGEEFRIECLAAGMNEYLTKPLNTEALLRMIASQVDPRALVLVVDDSADHRELLCRYLQDGNHYSTLTVSNGDDALALAANREPDVIIVDMLMPGRSGLETAAELRKRLRSNPIVIGVSANLDSEVRERCLVAGCDTVMQKPLSKAVLLRTLESLLALPEPAVAQADSSPVAMPFPEPFGVVPISSDISDLIPAFLTKRQHDCVRLRELLKEERFKEVERVGHKLKGNGGAYGFEPISECGAALERAAQQQAGTVILSQIDRLEHYLATVVMITSRGQRFTLADVQSGSVNLQRT